MIIKKKHKKHKVKIERKKKKTFKNMKEKFFFVKLCFFNFFSLKIKY